MKCKTETELVNAFVTSFTESLPRNRHYRALCEIETTWGKVDTIIISVHLKALLGRQRTIPQNTPSLTKLAALALVWLEDHPRTNINSMEKYLRSRNGTTRQVAELLYERKLIRIFKNDAIHLRSLQDILVINDILAFEAKLNKWQEVIIQAERHLWFTNKSYVVMPQLSKGVHEKVLSACREKSLGFITLNESGESQIHQQPLHNYHMDSYFRWKLNEHIVDQRIANGSRPC